MKAKFKWKKLEATAAWVGTSSANGLNFTCLIEKVAKGFKTEGIASGQAITTDFFIKSCFTRATTARLGAERALNTFLAEYKAKNSKVKAEAKPEKKEPLNRVPASMLVNRGSAIAAELEREGLAVIGIIMKIDDLKPNVKAGAIFFGGGQKELSQKIAMFNVLMNTLKYYRGELEREKGLKKRTK